LLLLLLLSLVDMVDLGLVLGETMLNTLPALTIHIASCYSLGARRPWHQIA
jgi:hypothetical protein